MQKTTGIKIKNQAAFGHRLREEFLRRCRTNPAYSLRSFARQLGVDASLLSKILRGKKKASAEMVKNLGAAIGLLPQEISAFLSAKEVQYQPLDDDLFAVISDWFHFAVLELIKTSSFQNDPGFIAKRLGIHPAQVQAALERLERLGFVSLKARQIELRSQSNTWANNEMTSAARRNLQKQLSLKAVAALDEIPFAARESGSLTVACAKGLLPEIKEKIQKFRRDLDQFIESHGEPDEVYQLVVSFYPHTKS